MAAMIQQPNANNTTTQTYEGTKNQTIDLTISTGQRGGKTSGRE